MFLLFVIYILCSSNVLSTEVDGVTTPSSNPVNQTKNLEFNSSENVSQPTPLIANTTQHQMERIIQPSQIKQVERSLLEPLTSHSNKTEKSVEKSRKEFRPSPQLETYFEYNKIPVPPAFPEAKQFGGNDFFFQSDQGYNAWNNIPSSSTTETPWVNRIKFPTPTPGTYKEIPYNFQQNNNKINTPTQPTYDYPKPSGQVYNSPPGEGFESFNKPTTSFSSNQPSVSGGYSSSHHRPTIDGVSYNYNRPRDDGFSFSKPVEVPEKKGSLSENGGKIPSILSSWINGGHDRTRPYNHRPYEYNIMERPDSDTHSHKDGGLLPSFSALNNAPWKKIIKFLAAFIPVGLLITALTPTVITVTPVNDTQIRSRSGKINEDSVKQLLLSIDVFKKLYEEGCEERVFCELLLTASSSNNAEYHVANLLNNFEEQQEDITNKADDLKKIFSAVKNQDCSPIHCSNMKNPT